MRKRLENKIKVCTSPQANSEDCNTGYRPYRKNVCHVLNVLISSAARGNTSLASTVQLTTALRHDISEFGKRVTEATESRKTANKGKEAHHIKAVLDSMKDLLRRIEDVPPTPI
jgi:hypothetical protein